MMMARVYRPSLIDFSCPVALATIPFQFGFLPPFRQPSQFFWLPHPLLLLLILIAKHYNIEAKKLEQTIFITLRLIVQR